MSSTNNSSKEQEKNKNHLRYENNELDAVDTRILRALYHDARISHAELSRQIGMSAPSVAERIRRLEDCGIITGYGARIEPKRLGFQLTILIRARPLPGKMRQMIDVIRETKQIVACDRVSGEDCFVARAHVRDVAEMEEVIDRIVPFGATNSSIVQSSPVDERLVEFQ